MTQGLEQAWDGMRPDTASAIDAVSGLFMLDWGLRPVMGAELEFYLFPDAADPQPVKRDGFAQVHASQIRGFLARAGIAVQAVTVERGPNQLEAVFRPKPDPLALAEAIEDAKALIEGYAESEGVGVSFAAKPFPEQPGSALQLTLSLENRRGQNMFFKKDEMMSRWLEHAIGGLLAAMPESMLLFAPEEESYQRFCGVPDAPVNVSWGANNRTTALRLPTSLDGYKHIEHRVPGSDVEPGMAVLAILAGAHWGLKHHRQPGNQTFGNAFDNRYDLPVLPKTRKDAEALLARAEILPEYLGDVWSLLLYGQSPLDTVEALHE